MLLYLKNKTKEEEACEGIAHKDAYRLDDAIKCFERALSIDGKFVKALWGKGVVYSNKGEYRKAILYFDRAIDIKL